MTVLYYLGLAALFTHEMDAVMHAEWRLLYGLRALPDDTAYALFLLLHLPLFFMFLWLSHYPSPRVREPFRLLTAAFLVIHAGLHFRLSDAPLYNFDTTLSNVFIVSAGLFGIAYLASRYLTARLTRHR